MDSTKPRLGSRELFPDLAAKVYANHAAIAPLSTPVVRALEELAHAYARDGFGAFAAAFERRGALRQKLARLLGARSQEIAFLPSTTLAVNAVALCFPWRKGDRLVLFEGEFPTNVTPWRQAAELFELDCVMLSAEAFREDEPRALEALALELERGVRLVAVSAVEFQTGYRMPTRRMSELCRDRGARLFVDAIQAVGVVPFDVTREGVDYLACGSQKWMMALDGIAFLYAREGVASELRPRLSGWLSLDEPVGFLSSDAPVGSLRYDRPIRRGIDFLEGGSLATPSAVALEASVDLLLELGPEAIFEHVNAYHDALEPKLVELGFESLRARDRSGRSGSLSLLPPEGRSLAKIHERLAADGIACSTPEGRLRLSPHWPNALDEVDLIAESLARAV